MIPRLQDSIVLITSSEPNNPKAFGTGFVIGIDETNTYVLTCAHVLRKMGGIECIRVEDTIATVIAYGDDHGPDLAVLKVKSLLDKPLLRLKSDANVGESFTIVGFQSLGGQRFLLREVRGLLGSQVSLIHWGQSHRLKAWELRITGDNNLQPGYSGSPVIDQSGDYVVGVVSDRENDGNRGLAISIECLEDIWSSIPEYIKPIRNIKASLVEMPATVSRNAGNLYLNTGAGGLSTSFFNNDSLVREVERIYLLLGASIQRKMLAKNYQLELLAKFCKGPIEFSFAIECKVCDMGEEIGEQDIQKFILKLIAAREQGKADKGVFVTNGKYAKNALETAVSHNIQCLNLRDLFNQLVNFDRYVEDTIWEFTNSDLAQWYIEQTGCDVEDYDKFIEQDVKQYIHNPLFLYVDEIFSAKGERRLALLGNFGTGKSSFCLKYRDILLRRYQADNSQRIPILINLRDYRSGIDIHQVITTHLQRLPGVQLDLELYLELQRMGRFFFILDGLDEMATKVDRVVVNENLREIDRLYDEENNAFLVTCRTHFFQERIADDILKDYQVVYLTEWGRSELEAYLKKRFPTYWKQYLSNIRTTPNLEELSKTPLLLDMIVKSLSSIGEGEQRKINSSKLYAAYTNEWITQQSRRRGAVMSTHQRIVFVESLAVKLYREDRIDLHYSDLYHVARELSGYGDATRVDYFDTDARTCTFVTKDSSGSYGFRHRSFMEFFVASAIVKEVNNNIIDLLNLKLLSNEILHFINGIDIDVTGKKHLHTWSKKFENEKLSSNSVKILLNCGEELSLEVKRKYGLIDAKWETLRHAIALDDDRAMDQFIQANGSELYSMVYISGLNAEFSEDELDDLYQEFLIRLWSMRGKKAFETANSDIGIQSYLRRIVQSLILERQRINRSKRELSLDDPSLGLTVTSVPYEQPSVDKEVAKTEAFTTIMSAIKEANLPITTERALMARYFESKTTKEIANELSVTEASVSSMLYRALSKLRSIVPISVLRDLT